MDCKDKTIIIIGAGPAGLSASYELGKKGLHAICLEASPEVGGISRTIEHNGYLFDIGGHGFVSSNSEVVSLWNELLGEDLLESPQKIGLYYKNRFFIYPPNIKDSIKGIGVFESCYSFCSLARSMVNPLSNASNMENWWINQYGRRFYEHFFKNYNEKVWGLPSNQISCEMNNWRSQNPAFRLLKNSIANKFKNKPNEVKYVVRRYPKYGAGQMYKEMALQNELRGNKTALDNEVYCIKREGTKITEMISKSPEGDVKYNPTHVISSMPLSKLVEIITPELSSSSQLAASKLIYRSLICVNLIIDSEVSIPYTFLYVNDPSINMVRLECFKNWNKYMVPNSSKHSLTCEYFVNEGEGLWSASDEELIALAVKELNAMNILKSEKVIDSLIVRVPKAYPVLDIPAIGNIKEILYELEKIENLHIIGRNGTHYYYDMEKSILSGLKVAHKIIENITQ